MIYKGILESGKIVPVYKNSFPYSTDVKTYSE